MSRPAGTLITTNNATYTPARYMPGYHGHVPTMKFDYGDTYGNASGKYFHDYRSESLNNSKSSYWKGGYFPSYYTHEPELLIENRTRTRDRFLSTPRYSLSTIDYDRQKALAKFDSMTQGHREHYKDKSGTGHRVDYFLLPTKADEMFKKHIPYLIMANRHSDAIQIPDRTHVAYRKSIAHENVARPDQRERTMRDIAFEAR